MKVFSFIARALDSWLSSAAPCCAAVLIDLAIAKSVYFLLFCLIKLYLIGARVEGNKQIQLPIYVQSSARSSIIVSDVYKAG